MKKILLINFKYNAPRSDLEKAFLKVAPRFGPDGDCKGLQWKIWIVDDAGKTAGGIYLFKDEASVETYLKGEIVAGLKLNPALSNIEAKVFDIAAEHTKISRGPVD